jgi:hypothetical protein
MRKAILPSQSVSGHARFGAISATRAAKRFAIVSLSLRASLRQAFAAIHQGLRSHQRTAAALPDRCGAIGREPRLLGTTEIAGIMTGIHGGVPGSSSSLHPEQRPSDKPRFNQTLEPSNKVARQPLKGCGLRATWESSSCFRQVF